ncbi:MAG: DUF169 domain-containing protein [Ardenticatenaceae bacterium]|nr:DUF169 domain-containing protein [Ardenticatenaceae bacterium]HBY93390.1 hypothetical protein [Chloroflexota bacterium]
MAIDPRTLNEALTEHIRPETFPVAVRLMPPGEDLPPKTRRPAHDLDIKVTICQGVAFSRRYGWTMAVSAEDLSCPLAAAVFGFRPMLDYMATGHACYQMYTRTLDAGATTETAVEKLPYQAFESILSAPLHRTTFEPDVVVVYGNAAQVMRLVTAALWREGGRITSSFSGRIDCSDEIIVPLRSQKPEVILPCYGDRIFAQTQDHEMAFSFPWEWAERLVEGLAGTHRGGVRYPIPSFLRYSAQFPAHYEKMNELWESSETGP